LEYRYVSDYLGGTIKSKNDLTQKLASAIAQYSKRQETWFRRMERNGTEIHWIARGDPDAAMAVCHERGREWGR
jgi:tRNA dimethylallyltransferase